jgi:hypothetical protein
MLLQRNSTSDVLSGLCRMGGCVVQIETQMEGASWAGAQAAFRKAGIPRLVMLLITPQVR